LRESGEPWLATISHVRDAYLQITEAEWEVVQRTVAGLRKIRETG
jgi:hypothetical protein